MAFGAFKHAKAATLDFRPMLYMDEYLTQKAAEARNADYVRTVRNGLSHFADFMRDENVMHPEEITRLHLVRFQGHCNQRDGWSDAYRIQILKKVRAWLNWMVSLDYIPTNPWVGIKLASIPKQPKPLSDEEVILLFAAHRQTAFSTSPFTFHRREMMLCLLYAWGLRIHELEALNLTNMDMRLDFVIAKNKGGGTKTLPYTPEIKRVYQRWSAARARHAATGEDALLITTAGTRLPKESIRTIITELGRAAGITINPHRMRDTCGTTLLDCDVPAERVQVILGHANLKDTLTYARVNNRKVLESAEDAMDPRLFDLFSNTRELRT